MKVVVIGSAGFLGKLICKYLSTNGYNVVPITRQNLDIADFNKVKEFLSTTKPYAIINCAIPGGRDKIDNLNQQDVDSHLKIFLNFFNLSHYFEKYINIGSGAEFDREFSINYAHETDIFTAEPIDNYGFMKNTIARIATGHEKFYTLRIFGCFDPSESEDRLFSKLFNQVLVEIDDREFDYISVKDFCTILAYYLNNNVIYRDVNCVYTDKKLISHILNEFVYYYDIPSVISIRTTNNVNYTGNSGRLDLLQLPLDGLITSIRNYK